MLPDASRELFRFNEFFAFEKNAAAFATVLLRRLFPPAPALWLFCSPPLVRLKNDVEAGGDNFFCDTAGSSVVVTATEFVSEPVETESAFSLGEIEISEEVVGTESAFSLGGLDEPLNILFSSPP